MAVSKSEKTGEEVIITARQVVTFRSSNVLKSEVAYLNKTNISNIGDNQ